MLHPRQLLGEQPDCGGMWTCREPPSHRLSAIGHLKRRHAACRLTVSVPCAPAAVRIKSLKTMEQIAQERARLIDALHAFDDGEVGKGFLYRDFCDSTPSRMFEIPYPAQHWCAGPTAQQYGTKC